MIRFLRGEYLYYESGAIVLETAGGIGFRIFVSDTSSLLTKHEGEQIEVYTYMQVKEDGMALYGFADTEGLALFEQLITVKGVGPKAGLAIMSTGTPNQIKAVIAAGDAASVAMAPGIGKKTAERVILELKDKVLALPFEGADISQGFAPAAVPGSGERGEAVVALTTLGYSKKEAESAVASVKEDDLSAEEYVKKSLKFLL
ncbi:MAG: Holliday junction branch migration protein RuvA [Clostridiales bacterium]|nr:Holliday junction branch migration protein RuvA [Clostridiales bacterium]MBR0469458.1 Holliday junction branch migration protein RuvA [Mogibacterium sp.]